MMSGHMTVQGMFGFTELVTEVTDVSLGLDMLGLHVVAAVGPGGAQLAAEQAENLTRTSLLQTFLTRLIQISKVPA